MMNMKERIDLFHCFSQSLGDGDFVNDTIIINRYNNSVQIEFMVFTFILSVRFMKRKYTTDESTGLHGWTP